jgi:dienelactone hydrolase
VRTRSRLPRPLVPRLSQLQQVREALTSGTKPCVRGVARLWLLGVALLVAAWAAPSASADPVPQPLPFDPGTPCPTYGEQQVCTAEVQSFDSTPLDVDLTRPLSDGPGQRHPLIVMLHGFGNDKHEWQSTTNEGDGADKYHWNSHWFAQHGYYVLTYTARGFDSRSASGNEPPTPPGTSKQDPGNGRIRLKSRESEVRDTQYLSALVAQKFTDIDRDRVAVTGGSYGGGESWLQASQAEWTFPSERFGLPKLSLQVAVPKYPWTDLAYALAPNGHPGPVGAAPGDAPAYAGADPIYESAQGLPSSDTGDGNPIGVPKLSYIGGLSAEGQRSGAYERDTPPSDQAATEEGQIDVPAWLSRIGAGDPYADTDPVIRQIRRGLTEFRSAYYQDWSDQQRGRKVAVFSIQGWTDDLFPALESFRMFKYLKRLDPRWPVAVEVADVGHSRGQNKPETWHRLNAQAFQFLQSNINGSHDQQTTVASQPTTCANDGEPDHNDGSAQRLTSTTPEGLAHGRLTVGYPSGALTSASGDGDPNGPATDPVFGGVFDSVLFGNGNGCRTSTQPALTAYTAVSAPLNNATTYIGLGSVTLPYTFAGDTGTVNARVWDVAPDGTTLLMTRGTYRLTVPRYDAPAGSLRLPLFGNHWALSPGHKIRLDLTEVDQGTFRRSNVGGAFVFSKATLELPTRQSSEVGLSGETVPTGSTP